MVHIGNDWDEILKDEWEKPYYKRLRAFLKQEYTTRQIFPDMHDIFNALKYTSFVTENGSCDMNRATELA